tara:strand:+ start:709 stop:1101 length:393 start_codon:yes stop_codon:yes gene_type:complete
MQIFLVNGIVDQIQKSIKINVKSPSAAIKKFLEVYPHSKISGVYPLPQEYESNTLSEVKEKWELILSKVELPSVQILLSQQAELVSFNSNKVEIAFSSNWFRMIEMRRLIIENVVKKIFGEQTIVEFLMR